LNFSPELLSHFIDQSRHGESAEKGFKDLNSPIAPKVFFRGDFSRDPYGAMIALENQGGESNSIVFVPGRKGSP